LSIRIGSNIAALQAQRSLGKADESLQSIYVRLSSGMRINRASDDAAGLSIASSLNTDSRIFTQAIRNVNDGISMLSIAEGALQSVSGLTMRLRELAIQSSNGVYGITQRRSLDAEADALVNEFNRVIASTRFNGINLLDGTSRSLTLQAGKGNDAILSSQLGNKLGRFVGTGSVSSHQTSTTSMNGNRILLADLNGDGNLDQVYGTSSSLNGTAVRLGNGDGTFRVEVTYRSEFTSPSQLIDLNGDGKLDLIGVGNGSGTISVALGNGDGSFAVNSTVAAGFGGGLTLSGVTAGDINGDGVQDLVSWHSSSSRFSVLIGNGNGTYQAATTTTLTGVNNNMGINLTDMNGDGRSDILVNFSSGGNLGILYANTNGSFAAPTTINIGSGEVTGVSATDMNGDGILDIIGFDAAGSNRIKVRLGNGNGTFGATISSGSTNGYTALVSGDLNGDGIMDLYSTYFGTGVFEALIGNGDGTFKSAVSYATGATNVFAPVIGDLDNNGSMEILFTSTGVGGVLTLTQNQQFSSNMATLNLNTRQEALNSLNVIDSVFARIQSELGSIGSFISRYSTTLNHLAGSREQYIAAESRIMDVDVAEESSALISKRIVQQAAAAILAQASQEPALALRLLQ
jgi:flagellin-like hook-associated protein FlgL